MAGGTRVDRWGYPVKTSSESCISVLNSYYDQVLSYGRNRAVILQAPRHDADCALAHALAAHFLFSSDPAKASSHLAAAASLLDGATSYERAVFKAVSLLLADDRDDDVVLDSHFQLLREFPKDLLSLKRAQVLCFYLGRPDLSLKLVEEILPHNQHESYIHGMHAFPLLEFGRMSDAERAAIKGLAINSNDIWSQHNLCHVFQNDCRFKEAVDFMETCSSTWTSCLSFMYTHNWWHVAVCYLEGHSSLKKVLDIYDYIWKELERSDADCGEVYINSLGLLLRIIVRGHMDYVRDRLKLLANIVTDESIWHMEWLLDLLAVWALSSSNKMHEAECLLDSMKSRTSLMSKKKQCSMQRGLQLAQALLEYGRGNYQTVFDVLGPEFDAADCKMIGASDEQLDVFNEVWYSVLLNTGHVSTAIVELEKCVKRREGSPFYWRLLEKAYSIEGRADASFAASKAVALEGAYFK